MTAPGFRARPSHHRCPGCRSVDVPNARLACPRCWARLPAKLQGDVWATRNYPLSNPARREALQAAVDAWRSQR